MLGIVIGPHQPIDCNDWSYKRTARKKIHGYFKSNPGATPENIQVVLLPGGEKKQVPDGVYRSYSRSSNHPILEVLSLSFFFVLLLTQTFIRKLKGKFQLGNCCIRKTLVTESNHDSTVATSLAPSKFQFPVTSYHRLLQYNPIPSKKITS